MAHLYKPFRQDVHGKPSDKLLPAQAHDFLFSLCLIVFIREGNSFSGNASDPVVADSNLMGVPTQIFNYRMCITKRFLRIHYPYIRSLACVTTDLL